MAKVSDLTASGALTGTELFYADNGSADVKVTSNQIKTFTSAPTTNDGAALGTTALGWSDLHLAIGGTLNWANGVLTIVEGTSMFSDGLLTVSKDFIVARNAGVGNSAEIGTKTIAPGGQEADTLYRYSSFVVNDSVHQNPVFGAAGIAGFFGVRSDGNTVSSESILGHNSFYGLQIDASASPENVGDFSGGLYLTTFFGNNFSNAVSDPTRPWTYTGSYVGLYDYGNLARPCRTSYTNFVGIQCESQHRGTGTATNVIGVRVVAGSGQAGGTTGACTNLTGIEILVSGTYQSITNARGLRIQDHSGIGAATENLNIKSEGANSINLFEGKVVVDGTVKTLSTIVTSLPSASSAGSGARAFVTDATATTFLSIVAGNGGNKVPVVSDGTNWLIG